MSDIISTLFSTEASANEKVAAFADLLQKLLDYVLGKLSDDAE